VPFAKCEDQRNALQSMSGHVKTAMVLALHRKRLEILKNMTEKVKNWWIKVWSN